MKLVTLATLMILSAFEGPEPAAPEVTQVTPVPARAQQIELVQPRSEAAPTASFSEMPDFTGYIDVRKKKADFFAYLLPHVNQANQEILGRRAQLEDLGQRLQNGAQPTPSDITLINNLYKRYRVKPAPAVNAAGIELLLTRVDTVPASLVLAQAANESGWGTSRFARKANNLFGIWCFQKGCGIKPLRRGNGQKHEVKRFDSVSHSIATYMHTLNTHGAYKELRSIRARSRSLDIPVQGEHLAEGLKRYSERGMEYVRDIQQLIRANNLQAIAQA